MRILNKGESVVKEDIDINVPMRANGKIDLQK